MLTFVIIGLLCNSQSCYWARVSGLTEFGTIESCKIQAENVKRVSAIYFETACMVK